MPPKARLYALHGESLPLSEWARRAGITYGALSHRLHAGETLEQALEDRPRHPGPPLGVSRGPRVDPRGPCAICGVLAVRSRSGRCESCRGVHRTDALVDAHTPYSEDLAAQAFVAAHPDGGTLEEIGEAMGVTRERVRQIEVEALRHFRQRARLAGVHLNALIDALESLAQRAS